MSKVKIFVDTGADLAADVCKEYDIEVINFLCVFDETSYVANEELSNAEFYEKLLAADKLPTTSQTPPGVMYDKLSEAAKENDTVIYFTLSSKASGQYNNARFNSEQIMEENPDADIRIVDTMNFSVFIGETAILCRKLLNDGMSVSDAISQSMKFINGVDAYVLVDDLKFLEMGGRITKTAAIVGGLLDIKPVLGIRDGLVAPLEKLRGKKKMYKKLMELIRENPEFDETSGEFCVVDSNSEYGDAMIEAVKEEFGVEDVVRRYQFGPIIGTHIGNGAVGVMFKKK
jgi:DegV family protein with EDD domain